MDYLYRSSNENGEVQPVEEREKGIPAIKDILSKIVKQEIRLNYTKVESPLPVGSSKLGGKPDLPPDFEWPEFEGSTWGCESKLRPLSFLVQINLKDVAAYDTEGLLPSAGLLSFFYECETMLWGYDPKDHGCARVFWFPEETELVSTDFPATLEEDMILPECSISFVPQAILPDYDSLVEGMNIDELCNWDDYEEFLEELDCDPDEQGSIMKLLGYPDVIQHPMEIECETVTRGYSTGSPKDYQKVTKEENEDIREKSKDWILLFQMGTVETGDYELMFGDCGYIYFWIRKEDLLARRFDRIWLILQCY